jgi:hypothetical protein
VIIPQVAGTITDEDKPKLEWAISAWGRLGISWEIRDVTRLAAQCPLDWYVIGQVDCDFTIEIAYLQPDQDPRNSTYDRARRVVYLNRRLVRGALFFVAVHELGHVLLDTDEHLPEGAVMGKPQVVWRPEQADYDLACRTIGVCIVEN